MPKLSYRISFEFTTDKPEANPLNWIPEAVQEQLEGTETAENFTIEQITIES